MAHAPWRPHRMPSPSGAWPLWNAKATRSLEAQASTGYPAPSLLERAGAAVARLAVAVAPPGGSVWVLTGSGHNGGDGWVAARRLQAAGLAPLVWEVQAANSPEARRARQQAVEAGLTVRPWPTRLGPGAHEALPTVPSQGLLIIDALLGLGARSPLPPPVAEVIGWVNACTQAQPGVRVLSVDLPSGLHPDTGARLLDTQGQPCAVRAHHTLSVLTLKPGLYTHEAGEVVGEVWFDTLGVEPLTPTPPDAPAAHLVPTEALALLRSSRLQANGQARAGGHKGSFGDVWLMGGAPGMVGALRLASRAAVAAGAGRVHRVELQSGVAPGPSESREGRQEPPGLVDDLAPEVMTRTVSDLARASLAPAVVVAGCGGGTLIGPLLPSLLSRAWRLVLDADALNALAAEGTLWARLQARPHHGAHTVLTPHPLEAARMLGVTTAQVQSDRLAAAQRLADRSGATVVLKGAGTVVATPGQVPWINASGNARLATGGTGDVLAGWIAGAWASTHAERTSLHDVVAACVHLHGKAADRLEGETGQYRSLVLPASELIAEMSRELMRTGHGHQP